MSICQGPVSLNFFAAVINSIVQKVSAFAIVSHFLLALTNTLAFSVTELITAVISFMIQTPSYNSEFLYENIHYAGC